MKRRTYLPGKILRGHLLLIAVINLAAAALCAVLLVRSLQAEGVEDASRIHLNYALYHLRQALRYTERSHGTYPLPGFDYRRLVRDVATVADGVEIFLNPRPGDPVRLVPAEIDGRYIAEELLREERMWGEPLAMPGTGSHPSSGSSKTQPHFMGGGTQGPPRLLEE